VGDDSGQIWLGRYPCVSEKLNMEVFGGHSTHVTALSFSRDPTSRFLFTAGGDDRSVMQWRHDTPEALELEMREQTRLDTDANNNDEDELDGRILTSSVFFYESHFD
jgi:hypothetical protein